MMINGVDYSLYIIAAVTFVVLAVAEYFICLKAKNPSARKILLFVPFFILVGALVVYGSESGGFLDLRGYVAFIIVMYALLCSIALFAGWFAFKLKYENGKEPPEACPFSEG